MGDSDNVQPPSKKRGALKQLSRENPGLDDEDDSVDLQSGTFKKASDDVLASRRIVRVKRKEPSAAPAATPNPFAGIMLAPPTAAPAVVANEPAAEIKLAPAEAVVEGNKKEIDTEEGDEVDSKKVDVEASDDSKKVDVEASDDSKKVDVEASAEKETEKAKVPEADNNGDKNGAFSSFQQHSSTKNAFTGLAGTEASPSSFSFGSVSQDASTGSGSLFGSSLFSAPTSSLFGMKKSEATLFPSKQEVSTETGEENEEVAFSADSIIFEYLDGGWKERGKGELKVNISSNGGKGRLVMRSKGNYRLILNASLYPEMKLASMDKKGITFACVNSVSEDKAAGLSTFALKFKDPTIVEQFRVAVEKHKDSKAVTEAGGVPLKTPENSPTEADA